ncbi:hypothetical protein RB619_13135 [Flavobacterium sp. LHD-80]|uniref:hypothetical protein n=1 Tax=Flavobacterium sp. LHD-80 TaxID=3071411 RepID=UPI0027DFB110|nr:hypothetical protein [Flavobacterium sp. LHD-80]MDQ6471593.1 hypothetical protein [Flavobacterium sp. LHD-80]
MRKILLIILTAVIFQSCNFGSSGTQKNEDIEASKVQEIKVVNDKLFKAIMSNDIPGVKALLSDKLLTTVASSDLNNLVGTMSANYPSKSYTILDQYYVSNTNINIPNTLISGVSGDNDYVISYKALNKEMFTVLFMPTTTHNDALITVIYGKYGNEWKINILQFGQYTLLKKTASDYYKLAQENYKKGYLIDAVNDITVAKQCLNPAGEFFKYEKEQEINNFYDKVLAEAKAKFILPLTLENVESKPKVFRIFPQMTKDGFMPEICYVSSIKLADTVALKKENEKVKIEVAKTFYGIDKGKTKIFYGAYNEMPDGKKEVMQYRFIEVMKKVKEIKTK